jgi:hypothetical protein
MMLTALKRKYRTFRNLTQQQQSWIARASLWLPTIGAMLWLLGFARSRALLDRVASAQSGASPDIDQLARARDMARWVRIAGERGLYRATCLPQSLLLWHWLRQEGIDTDLRMGVRRTGAIIEAHAWLEHDGVAINDDEGVHQRFAAFDHVSV